MIDCLLSGLFALFVLVGSYAILNLEGEDE